MGTRERLGRAFRQTPGPTGKNDAGDPNNTVKTPDTPSPVGGNSEVKQELQASLDKVDRMIAGGRSAGLANAARHLEHWRNGSGKKLIMPASAFEDEEFIQTWLRDHVWKKFVEGTQKRLKSGELRPGGSVSMYWIDSLYAESLTDLYFALGGFTIRCDVVVRAEQLSQADGGGLIFVFDQWKCKASDKYNWDLLKSTYIPGIGRVEDEELRVLEKNGYGKMFDIESEPWSVTNPNILQEFSVQGY